jgi:type VI secretion system protein ImpK
MNGLHSATQESFNAIRQLRRVDPLRAPPAEALQQKLKGYLDSLRDRLKREGHTQEDAQDVLYALVALADEVALNLGDPVSTAWGRELLQMHYFRENTAGDGFFEKLKAIRKDRSRSKVLWVYAMCLSLGFQGKYQVRGGELELLNMIEELHRELGPPPVDTTLLAPDGERPNETFAKARTQLPVLLASVGLLVIGVLVFTALRVNLAHNVSQLRELTAPAPQQP